jgi:hypothetical protein
MKMQTSGDQRGENANAYSVVVTREGGYPVFQRQQ